MSSRLKKKLFFVVIIIPMILIAIVLVAALLEAGKEERDLTFKFDNYTYIENHPSFTTPSAMSKMLISKLDSYNSSVIAFADLYYSAGPEQALLALHEKLSSSMNEAELLEIQETLLFDGGGTPLLFQDPHIVFQLFEDRDEPTWNDNQKAAADYLIALAYARGDFRGALMSEREEEIINSYNMNEEDDLEAEEINERLSKKLKGVREEGIDRLLAVWETYPSTRVGILAGFDYLTEIGYQNGGATELGMAKELLQASLSYYPESAFLTLAHVQVGNAYRGLGDKDKALEHYKQALTCPDYMGPINDLMVHESLEKYIQTLDRPDGF